MKMQKMLGTSLAALLAVSAALYAADGDKPAGDKPADAKTETKADAKELKGVRLIKPYSDLKDLSADQTTKLKEIHKRYADQIKALEAKQREEMATVLTDAQKKAVADLDAKSAAEKKAPKKAATATPPAPVNTTAAGDTKDAAKDSK